MSLLFSARGSLHKAVRCMPVIMLLGFALGAVAADQPQPLPSAGTATSTWATQQHLLGDWGGARTKLSEEHGISFDFFLHTDLLANVKGGQEQKAAGWNRSRGTMDIDMGRLAGVKGMSFHITGLWNGGVNLGEGRYLGSLATPSGNATPHLFRLDSFWIQQNLFGEKLSLSAGQISGMDFFGLSPDLGNYVMEPLFYAPFALFNTYSSWDPATTPAAMVKIAPTRNFYYKAMVQAGNRDQISQDPSGTGFAIKNGAVWNNEFGFLVGRRNSGVARKLYPGHYRFGVSYNGSKFVSMKTGSMEHGNYLAYFMSKQTVWSREGKSLQARFDLLLSPNEKGVLPYNKEIVVGAVLNGLVPHRTKDSINFGMNYYGIRNFLDTPSNTTLGLPVTSEKAFEINYSAQITPWLQAMPVFQIYKDLGANPGRGTGMVAGIRTKVNF
jgi:porin